MTQVLKGDAAERVLIDKAGITRAMLDKKVLALGEAAVKLADGDVSVMLNIYIHGLCSLVSTIEQHGEPGILETVLQTVKAGVAEFRAENKRTSN